MASLRSSLTVPWPQDRHRQPSAPTGWGELQRHYGGRWGQGGPVESSDDLVASPSAVEFCQHRVEELQHCRLLPATRHAARPHTPLHAPSAQHLTTTHPLDPPLAPSNAWHPHKSTPACLGPGCPRHVRMHRVREDAQRCTWYTGMHKDAHGTRGWTATGMSEGLRRGHASELGAGNNTQPSPS